ncbi:MAG: peroxidase-related enzyme [Gammaproteobacteria bacterium]|nr:peroxidase-related enzyme [Gammaproteobacteria bacterium]
MTWIKTIPYEEAEGQLLKLYERVKGPDNNVDNIMLAHSLRPHSMTGHMTLYKNVLHNSRNTVEKWTLELFGVYTSMLNECDYCVEHHFNGLKNLLKNDAYARDIRKALVSEDWESIFEPKLVTALAYIEKLTRNPATLSEDDINKLRNARWDDGEILEINQVTAYFNYANRTVLGLGINTEGDILGLSPNDSDDEQNWQHT